MIELLTGALLSAMVIVEPPQPTEVKSFAFVATKQTQIQEYTRIKKGKRVSYSGSGYQCVDLAKDWYSYITWRPAPHFNGSARRAWYNGLWWMQRTDTPTPWDLVFMDYRNSKYSPGHVGVFLYMDGDYAVFLDQNGWWWGWSWRGNDAIKVNSIHASLLLGFLTFEEAGDKNNFLGLKKVITGW
jgi:hypothetical protein